MIRRLLLLFCLFAHLAAAQPLPQRQFLKQFGAAEGLPQPFIYALAQDRAGYLWIGTAEGLVRFDGTTFQTFTTREGLAEDFVTQLAQDPRTGRLWVAHYQGSISVSDEAGFRRTAPPEATALRPTTGLFPPDTAGIGRFRRRYQPALPPDAVISQVLRDAEGTYWVATTGLGLWRLTDPGLRFYPTSARLTTLAGDGPLLLAGTANGQLLRLQPGKAGLQLTPLLPPLTGSVTAVLPAAAAGWSLIGTDAAGVYQQPTPELLHLAPVFRRSNSPRQLAELPANVHITSFAPDATSGGMWVGTIGEGAFHVTGRQERHYTTANGLLQNDVYAILPDRQGRVWFATHGTGLAVLENGRFRVHRLVPGGVDATALAQDAAGRVWVGTEGDGLFCYANGRFRQFTTLNSGLASNYCYGLQPTKAGLLVQHRNGLSLGQATRFAALSTPDNPLVRDLLPNASALLPAPDSAVLLAARSGLVRVQLPARLAAATALVSLTGTEVDGKQQPATPLPELPARPHHLTWFFRVASLAPTGTWQYQYRLRGFQESWSRPSTVAEADFPRLDAGHYTLEVRARRGSEGKWSPVARAALRIATPFWRTWWFGALLVGAVVGVAYAFTRARTATLRRQKLQLETTVRERTTELRQQKAEIEQINADLIVARDAAEASRRAKAQFLANMSHEIRTPMNAVIGLTHLLRNTPVNGEQGEYLEAIQSSSNNLLVIINDILDSSKMEAGKLTLEQAPFLLPELVERVARMFQFATEAKGLYFRTEVAPNVPAAILGDSVRLNQVLVNLVGNAVKFTTTGGVTLHVTVVPAAETGTDMLRFGVQDTGIGIPADKLDTIFEDFSQANTSTTRQFGGTGLGLSIARNLVQLHGGRLWVESQEGQGSTFWFDIPCLPANATAVRAEASGPLLPFEPALRVLVAEDNDLNQLVARKTLEAWNVQVTLAANGRLAVEAAQQQVFDAVLLDVQMPEMDGYEAARQLRALFPDAARLPLIGLTASALPEDRALALEAGMNDTLAKPFDPAVLYARLAHFTGRALPASLPASTPVIQPAAVAATTALPDWSLLEELAGGNEAFVQQIIRTFLAQAPPLAVTLLQIAPGPDMAQAAHKLKGQAAYFGVSSLTQVLEEMEQLARQPEPAAHLSQQAKQVQDLLTALYPHLHQRLGQTPPN